jgi:hypothetical protein
MVFDTIGTSSSITYSTSTGLFSLVAGVTYELQTNLYVQFEGSTNYISNYQWVDSSNNALSPTQGQAIPVTSGYNDSGVASQSLIYTPSQNINVKVRWVGVYGGRMLIQGIKTWAKVIQLNPTVAVQATATGTVNNDYIQAAKSTAQASVSKNSTINFDTVVASSNTIPFANNAFTLTAGKTYELDASLVTNTFSSTAAYIWYSWVDATTLTPLDTVGGSAVSSESSGVTTPMTWTANDGYYGSAKLIYTPNTNQTVKLYATDGSGTCTVLSIGTRITIRQINQAFALNALATMATTGDVSVGGNLTVTGNIAGTAVKITAPTFQAVTPSWGLNDVASAAWFLLGTWNTSQAGNCLYMRLLGHCGYNGVTTQNQVTELMFVTSNDSSYIAGSSGNYYAAGSASVNSRLGTGATYQAPNKFRIIQVSKTQYQIYAYFGSAYMRNSNYSIQITPGDTWTDGGGNGGVTAPTGNYVEITPSSF